MSDDSNAPPPDNQQPPALAPQGQGSSAPTITPEIQALIDAAAREAATKANNAAWKQAREKYEKPAGGGGQAPPAKSETQSPPSSPPVDVRAELNRIRSFERAAGQFGLSAEALEILEGDFNTANPQDPGAWVKQRAAAFGWKAAGSNPAPSAPATPAPKAHQGPPVTGSGAPANPTTVTDDTPILRMSNEARESLRRTIGDAAYVERMRKEFRTVRVRG